MRGGSHRATILAYGAGGEFINALVRHASSAGVNGFAEIAPTQLKAPPNATEESNSDRSSPKFLLAATVPSPYLLTAASIPGTVTSKRDAWMKSTGHQNM